MVEISHGGFWIKWSSLDQTGKRLAATSLVAAALSAIASVPVVYRLAYDLGRSAAKGEAVHSPANFIEPYVVIAALAFMVLSGICWWRFSLRQDEMFNRVQNWAIGMGGGWMVAVLAPWSLLALAELVEPPSALTIVLVCISLPCLFWLVAVRRWAS